MEAQITVSILSWLLEERLIKTLINIPRSTSLPLNLCLHVQGSEQIPARTKQRILDATSGFLIRDVFFTEGNQGAAKPRAELLKRSAITPFIFMTDNDMDFQPGSIDELYNFLISEDGSPYGMIDLAHNYLKWHRTVDSTKVTCIPLNYGTQHIVDVDLIGAASILMRKEVALLPDVIDTRYDIGTWDFDMSLNVKYAGWKIATLCDRKYIAVNDKTHRTPKYLNGKVRNKIRLEGLRLFEKKWGFSSEEYPYNAAKIGTIKEDGPETFIISRAIYTRLGDHTGVGILDPHRLEMMQTNFINSLQSQTNKDFHLYMVVGTSDNETTKAIKDLDWGDLRVHFCYVDTDFSKWNESIGKFHNWGREMDPGCPEVLARTAHPKAPIMARLDTDDWVAPGWVAHMKYVASTAKERHFLINYQVIGQSPNGLLYRFFAPHNPGRTSPFIALVQHDSNNRISPYEDIHLNMGSRFPVVYTVPPAYAFMVVHGQNRSNRIYAKDRLIGIPGETIEAEVPKIVQIDRARDITKIPTKIVHRPGMSPIVEERMRAQLGRKFHSN